MRTVQMKMEVYKPDADVTADMVPDHMIDRFAHEFKDAGFDVRITTTEEEFKEKPSGFIAKLRYLFSKQ